MTPTHVHEDLHMKNRRHYKTHPQFKFLFQSRINSIIL